MECEDLNKPIDFSPKSLHSKRKYPDYCKTITVKGK